MQKRRVVVTGLGLVSPVGNDVETAWQNVLEARSGIRLIKKFDVTNFAVKIAGTIENFDCLKYLDQKEIRKFDDFVQYGLFAAMEAFADADLKVTDDNCVRIGTLVGSGIGGLLAIENARDSFLNGGPRRISPYFIPSGIANMASGLIAIKLGLKGPSFSIASACATGAHAIGVAMRLIESGDADVMLAGGTENAVTELGLGGFVALRALSKNNEEPEQASRPWNRDRDGFVMSDGAGVLVLEEYSHALKRKAKIYGEVIGFGSSADAYHITAPDPLGKGAILSIQNALKNAEIDPSEVDYINAHATSTRIGDLLEVQAIKHIFGARKLPVSSTKSVTGHLLGAAGAVEAIFSLLAIRDKVIPPTANLVDPDDGCDLDFVPLVKRKATINTVLSNSFGFGGTNATLIFRRVNQ